MPAATVDHSQRICEVWANNLEEELKRIRHVIRKYNYIAMVSGACRAAVAEPPVPTFPLFIVTRLLAGHGVSRCCSQTDRRVQKQR